MKQSRAFLKPLARVVIVLASMLGLFQQVQAVQGKNQPAGVLLSANDVPPGFIARPAQIYQSGGACRGKSVVRSFNRLDHTGILHEIKFCESATQSALDMRMYEDDLKMNAPGMLSFNIISTDQKPANADEFWAVCYQFMSGDIKMNSCKTVVRYGRLISTLIVGSSAAKPVVTRNTLLNWTFHRNDRLLIGPTESDWATLLGRAEPWRA